VFIFVKEQIIQFKIREYTSKDDLSSLYLNLLHKAAEAAHKAYAPYSNFYTHFLNPRIG
jgi:hypothetical protein